MSIEVETLEKKVRKKFKKNDVSFGELRRIVAETNRGIAELRRENRIGIAELRQENRIGIAELRQENRIGIAELRRENCIANAELRQSITELRQSIAETNHGIAELRREHEKTERVVKRVSKIVGGMGNNHGKFAEFSFVGALKENPVFGGENYDCVMSHLHPARGGFDVEFDIVMTNSSKVALIEVKYCAHPNDLRKLVEKKVSEFRRWCPDYANRELYLGIASLSFNEEVVEEAQRIGVGVLRQVGKTLEITAGKLKAF
jgi:hypothetical protein